MCEGWKKDGAFLSLKSIYNLLGNVTRADIIFHPTKYVMKGGGFVYVLAQRSSAISRNDLSLIGVATCGEHIL